MEEYADLVRKVDCCITDGIVSDYESARAKAVSLQLQVATLDQLTRINQALFEATVVEEDEFGVGPM